MGVGYPLTVNIERFVTMEECMMKRHRLPIRDPRPTALVLLVFTAAFMAPIADAAESDLWSNQTGPGFIPIGAPFTMTIGYGNSGPDTAVSAYVNTDFIPPMGLDVFLDNYFNGDGSMYTAMQDSAAGTDTNGNSPLLFWDDFYCENTFFQLQGDATPEATPIRPLEPGGSGAFTYEVTLPMEAPKTGTLEITEIPEVACAAQEDLDDSRRRFRELLEPYWTELA